MQLTQSARAILARSVPVCLIAFICLSVSGITPPQKGRRSTGKRPRPARERSQPIQAPAPIRAALNRISPNSLRGHLSFIASDLLEGR
ncbi:MAG TPA: hypothetical protein VJ302_11660, partial [Blastocatellia bacterium]|nr:hypothetical protein [Blastocatellia bacterium]